MVLNWFLIHNTQLGSWWEPYSAVQCIDIRVQTVAGSGLVGVAVVGAQLVPDPQHPAGQLERSTSSDTQWVLGSFGHLSLAMPTLESQVKTR